MQFTCALCFGVLFISCNSDDDTKSEKANQFTINGETYPIKTAIVEYYGAIGDAYNLTINLTTTPVNDNNIPVDKVVSYVFFEAFSDSNTLENGTYHFSNATQISAYTFTQYSQVVIDRNIEIENSGNYLYIKNGKFNILNNTSFEISFTGTAGEKEFSGYYKGDIIFMNEDPTQLARH